MKITGAVLADAGVERPYALSRPLRVEEIELDPPGAGEILVRIEAAGLCHSDLSVINGSRPRPLPMLLGHEAAGIVVGLGPDVDDIRVGERVVMTFLPRCGECEACATDGRVACSVGSAANNEGVLLGGGRRLHRDGAQVNHHLGVSGFADHAVVSRRSVVAVPDDVPADLAAVLGCAVLTGGGAVLNAAEPEPGESLAVIGLGGVGMAALAVAAGIEGVRTVGIDMSREKLDTALALGADEVYTPDEALEAGIRVSHAVEAAGHPAAFETALALTKPGGRTVTVGLPAPDARASISPLLLTAEARTIIGSYLGSAVAERDIPIYVTMWRQGRLPLERLVSGRIGLEQINEGMDDLADAKVLRQIVTFP